MRQSRIAEDAFDLPLVLVEAVDCGSDNVFDIHPERFVDLTLDAAERFHGPIVRVDDVQLRVGDEHVGLEHRHRGFEEIERIQLAIKAGAAGSSGAQDRKNSLWKLRE